MGPQSAGPVNYTQDAYPQSIPALSPDTYNALTTGGGPDPALPFTINFNSFVPGGVANSSAILFSIVDTATFQQVFFQSLSAGATSVVVPGNILTHAGDYEFVLGFENDIISGITFQQFDYITTGDFQGATGSLFLSFFN